MLLTAPFTLPVDRFLKPNIHIFFEDQLRGRIILTLPASQLAEWVRVLLAAPFTLPDDRILKPISTILKINWHGRLILTLPASQLAEWVGVLLAGR